MSYIKATTVALLLLGALILSHAWASLDGPVETVRVGILAHRGVETALRQWQPTMDYLTDAVSGYRFEIVTVNNDDIELMVASGELGFVLTNPGSYITLESRQGIYRVATLIRSQPTGPQAQFGAVIFTRNNSSDIQTLQDLVGRSFIAVHPKAFGGWRMGWRELKDAGIDPDEDFSLLQFSGFPQSRVVDAVMSGRVDAGTVRTDVLERMIQQGKFNIDDIHVLNPIQAPGFNALLSTRLYPEWPLAITRDTDRRLARKVVMALYALPFNDPVLSAAGIAGWTIPYDYTPVHDLMRELKVGPYENLGEIEIRDVLRQYWPWFLGLGFLLAGLVVFHTLRLLKLVHESRQSLHNTLYSIGDAVITTDTRGLIEFVNPAAEKLLNLNREVMVGRPYEPILPLSYEHSNDVVGDLVAESLERNTPYTIVENIQLNLNHGDKYSIKLTTAPIMGDSGQASGCVLVLHDVTDMQHMTQKLRYQASHDPLTDLYNRREFEQLLMQAIYRVKRYKIPVSLLYLDLDNFKIVNDSSGHFVGDELLKQVAQLLRSRLRESDILARLGGDEFGILLDNCQLSDAQGIAGNIHKALDGFRFQWDEHVFQVGVSIGIVPLRLDSEPSIVMGEADAACYVAKAHGRNRYHVYQVDDSEVMQHHGEVAWVQRISRAFEEDRFELYCQPIMSLNADSDESNHYEVLIRLRDEEGKLIPPSAFLPAAERYNLMPTIDRWVVRTVFAVFSKIGEEKLRGGFNINLSGQTLGDEYFQQFLIEEMERNQVPAESICFEVTETAAISRLDSAVGFITDMRARGCRFALDDFGTGVSTFSYLRNLPLDYVKIDGSFVRDMVDDELMAAMVDSINQIVHVVGLKSVAEFVENDAILGQLKDLGVDYAQGYTISRPFPMSQLFN